MQLEAQRLRQELHAARSTPSQKQKANSSATAAVSAERVAADVESASSSATSSKTTEKPATPRDQCTYYAHRYGLLTGLWIPSYIVNIDYPQATIDMDYKTKDRYKDVTSRQLGCVAEFYASFPPELRGELMDPKTRRRVSIMFVVEDFTYGL